MSNNESLDILTARVESLETIIFGSDKIDNNTTNQSISNRIENITTSVNTFEKDIPSIQSCRELSKINFLYFYFIVLIYTFLNMYFKLDDKLEPIIIQSKLNLNQVNDKIIEVMVSK
jgi:hypothetical protein